MPGRVAMRVNSMSAPRLRSRLICCSSPSTGSTALYRFHVPLCTHNPTFMHDAKNRFSHGWAADKSAVEFTHWR